MRARLPTDPLWPVELSVLVEVATSDARHNVRNKLGSIRNAAYYVRRRLSKTEAWASDDRIEAMSSLLDADVTKANELVALIDQRLHTRAVTEVDVTRCLALAVEHARVDPSVTMDIDSTPGRVSADPRELAVAVRCLIENAAEAMDGRGRVRVRARVDPDQCRIDVIDEGPGVSEEARERVFEPFFTSKPGRAGLGLNIADRVAHRGRGKVALSPAQPIGAEFALMLPIGEPGAR